LPAGLAAVVFATGASFLVLNAVSKKKATLVTVTSITNASFLRNQVRKLPLAIPLWSTLENISSSSFWD